jgi:hypothetical protein
MFSYPSTYIDAQFGKFFGDYISSTSILPLLEEESQFFVMRKNLLKQPTDRQSQVEMRAAIANINNEEGFEESTVNKPIPKKNKNNTNNLILHYTHEKRLTPIKRDMHQILDDIFHKYLSDDFKLIVGNRNSRDTQRELIRKRPPPWLLTNKPAKSKYFLHYCSTINMTIPFFLL